MSSIKLSINGFERMLHSNVANASVNPSASMTLAHFEVCDSDSYLLEDDCLYLCLENDIPPCNHIQPGCSIICLGRSSNGPEKHCGKCSILEVEGISTLQLINSVGQTFARYGELASTFRDLLNEDDSPDKMIEIASLIVGAPLCLLDVNYDIIAASKASESTSNPFWRTIELDSKQTRCEILDRSTMELQGFEREEFRGIRYFSLLDYHTLCCRLYRKEHLVASLWMPKMKPRVEFDNVDREMFAWICSQFAEWAMRTRRLTAGRNTINERFLLDMASGVFSDDSRIARVGSRIGYPYVDDCEYQIMILRAADKLPLKKYRKTLHELEEIIPKAICAFADFGAIALFPTDESGYLPPSVQHELDLLCKQSEFQAMVSNSFIHLCDMPRIVNQLLDCFDFVDREKRGNGLFHYYDYLVLQNMRVTLKNQPPETLIHPMIRKLVSYDEENNSDYVETFKVYLNNRCNVTETAKQLHMHRNTLLNRVKRIETLLGDTFEDWTLRRILLFSLDYLHLSKDGKI